MRQSTVKILYSSYENDNGWTGVEENGISNGFYLTRIMFCSGNCTERMRYALFNVADKVVVNLYAGIGDYTLPLLVHGKCTCLHACEMKPYSVEALQKNLDIANVRKVDIPYICYIGCISRSS
jgi:tRNA G37 N-methylase Trm5